MESDPDFPVPPKPPRVIACDQWMVRPGPQDHVVVSSRARLARNLPGKPFPMRAKAEELAFVLEEASRAVVQLPHFRGGHAFYLHDMPPSQRQFLKESHLISAELEKGGIGRAFLVSPDVRLGAMINEEDHLRLFSLRTGLRPSSVLEELIEFDTQLQSILDFAYDSQYGYLTACPTNTGTGLRLSVMLHVPALSTVRILPEIVSKLPAMGLVVRGIHGENSEFLGDYCQVSNEVTLGITEQETALRLITVVEEIVQREERTRRLLIDQNRLQIEDETWRAFGLLTHARTMPTNEALTHLSRLRMGIDLGFLPALTHADLTRLTVAIHPAHIALAFPGHEVSETEVRDRLRADLLRQVLGRG